MQNPFTIRLLVLIIPIWILVASCNEEVILDTNLLYETLYDDVLKGKVKEVHYIDSDLNLIFDNQGNLSQRTVPSKSSTWEYKTEGDTIVNQIAERQKILYILDEKGDVKEYVSLVFDGNEWYTYYKEDWSFDGTGRLVEKKIMAKESADRPYFINRIVYKYDKKGKVEIFKYGKDEGSNTKNGLLRTETRLANDKGNWIVIEELDEDGIPYIKSNFSYEYDVKGNWTEVILKEENNYTGESATDTIRRKVIYY